MTKEKTARFGFEFSYLDTVNKRHQIKGGIRSGCYVPTEEEVQYMAPDELTQILIDWFWESPSELIPNDQQVGQVRDILLTRPDQEAIKAALFECDDYMGLKDE